MSYQYYPTSVLQPRKLPCAKNLFNVHGDSSVNMNCDRFIPCRANNNWETNFATIPDASRGNPAGKKVRETGEGTRDSSVYNCLLRNELLRDNIEDVKSQCDDRQALTPVKNKNLFRYGSAVSVGFFTAYLFL